MSEQKNSSIKMIITVTLEGVAGIKVDALAEIKTAKGQPNITHFLERIKKYISGEEATTAAIKKAKQDTLMKISSH